MLRKRTDRIRRILQTLGMAKGKKVSTKSAVCDELKAVREEAGLTVRALAEELDLPASTYSNYELRFKKPFLPMDLVQKMEPILVSRGVDVNRVRALGGASRIIVTPPPRISEVPVKSGFPLIAPSNRSDHLPRLYELKPSAFEGSREPSVPYLFPAGSSIPTISVTAVKVIGDVQAGLFKPALEWPPEDQFEVDVPMRAPFNRIRTFGLQLSGPSMDLVFPDGSVVICAWVLDLGAYEIKSGHYVVALRRDAAGDIEATVKQVQIDADGVTWLWPRSSHPDFQQPWRVSDLASGREDTDEEIAVWALVVADTRMRV